MSAVLKSTPLLKFKNKAPVLAPEGLELMRQLKGRIFPVIFIGDGRGGKSLLASCLVGAEDAFLSSDSAESVTEGIDAVAVPLSSLQAGGKVEQDDQLLIMDCEGGNNALADINTLVNVFGLLLGSQVVFIASGLASEQALQNLSMSLAARSLVRLDEGSRLPDQELFFVVNKNTLRYEGSALEKILEQKFDDPGRQELRDTVRECFPTRAFFTVPIMGMPNFNESLQALRAELLDRRRPLSFAEVPVKGDQLAGLMELIVAEVQKSEAVSVPSINRYVIYEGFLQPLVKGLTEMGETKIPQLSDYDPDLDKKNPLEALLKEFDEKCKFISYEALKSEARINLSSSLREMWHRVQAANIEFANEIISTSNETRDVVTQESRAVLGCSGLLRDVVITQQVVRQDARTILQRKHGGEPDCTPWKSFRPAATRMKETAFDSLPKLPCLKAALKKLSPNWLRKQLGLVKADQQTRLCILKDAHLLWIDPEQMHEKGEVQGCLNFFYHRAEVAPHPSVQTAFVIRPAEKSGWNQTATFTGNASRDFMFDTEGSEHDRAKWLAAIKEHIEFAELASEQLGQQCEKQIRLWKPTIADLELELDCGNWGYESQRNCCA